MTFKNTNWDDPSMFRENLGALGYNIFKIKYFYEEDQLDKLSRSIHDVNTRDSLVQGYMEAADEATVYLKTINAFLTGNASLPDDKYQLEWLLEYFLVKERHLLTFELESEEGLISWIENREYCE